MKFVGIKDNKIVAIFDWVKDSEKLAVLPDGITVKEAPDYVTVDFIFENNEYIAPIQPGFIYDYVDGRYYSHNQYRKILHQKTSNDTLQAMRKLRENDTSYDWQSWLDKLDAYNKAIEDTRNQETYPDKVDYPNYPEK